MKKVLLSFVVCLALFSIKDVRALEEYYKNDNGVSLSKEEYDFLSDFYWPGCQELMKIEDYQKFLSSNIMNQEIKKIVVNEPIPRSTWIEDSGRTLQIATSCGNDCTVSVTLRWNNAPYVRSYDVMGAYLENVSLLNTPTTTIQSSNGASTNRDVNKQNNGFGVSFLLPSGNNLVINQSYRVSKGGHIYASYQHAKQNISLLDSKRYSISKSGYGKVFSFTGNAAIAYDRMNGVDIGV